MDQFGLLIGLGVLLLFVIALIPQAIRIVREYQRLVVFRLGRLLGTKGPRPVILIPFVDKAVTVDLREFFLEIPRQDSITKDNAPISIDFITFYKVLDPQMSVVQVANFAGAAQTLAAPTLRAVVGDIPLDDVLAKRDEINQLLRAKLDEVTERWGVKVTNVEIREIIPPPSVQEAMTRQMSAERQRGTAGARRSPEPPPVPAIPLNRDSDAGLLKRLPTPARVSAAVGESRRDAPADPGPSAAEASPPSRADPTRRVPPGEGATR